MRMGHSKHRQVNRGAHRQRGKETAEKVREREYRIKVANQKRQIASLHRKIERMQDDYEKAESTFDACDIIQDRMTELSDGPCYLEWRDYLRAFTGADSLMLQMVKKLARANKYLLKTMRTS